MEGNREKERVIRPEIRKASNRKILRKQMELLTERSFSGTLYEQTPNAAQSIAILHKELVKSDGILFVRIFIALFGFAYFIKRFPVKRIQFVKR